MAELKLGDRLRQARTDRGLSLREIERRSGVNSGYLSQLERNDVANPGPATLQKIAKAYEEPFSVLMEWAGYVERDPEGLAPNAKRALSVLGQDFTDEELHALKSVLDAIRAGKRATFDPSHRTDFPLDPEDQLEIRRHAMAVLREIDALGEGPVNLDDVLVAAKLVQAGVIELQLEERKRLFKRFGNLVTSIVERVQGLVHLDSREVYVKPDLHPMRERFVIGHETGHAVLPDHRAVFAHLDDHLRLTPEFNDRLERQANHFAVELLAKGDRLREEFDDSAPTAELIGELSDRYSLSRQATARYIGERSKQCCAVAISHRAKRTGQLMPFKLYCSDSFEQRLHWQAGLEPRASINDALSFTAAGVTPVPLVGCDPQGQAIDIAVTGFDARWAVIVFFHARGKSGRTFASLFRAA